MKKLDTDTALSNRRKNPFSIWHRNTDTSPKDPHTASERLKQKRLTIGISPSFQFNTYDPIFTMGSCFARRLENTLHKKGSKVPMYEEMLKNRQLFPNSTPFNKYNTFSMLYELEWALGVKKYEPTDSIANISDSKFIDLQSVPGDFNPSDIESLLSRRTKVSSLTKSVLTAKVVTLTLGLTETWYDLESNRYLNMTPDVRLLKASPNRFELRLIGIDENLENLNSIHSLISEFNNDFNMIVTVSPVPLLATFTDMDVIIATTLSKSNLLCSAHIFAQQHPNVDYFPSYEMASLSQRENIWESDLRHVSESGANYIIETFLENYSPRTRS